MIKKGLLAFRILAMVLLSIPFVSAAEGSDLNFQSDLYKGKTYTNAELVDMGKHITERDDLKIAIEQAADRCSFKGAKCDDWMTPSYCSDYLKSTEQDRLADCDYIKVTTAAMAAYEASKSSSTPTSTSTTSTSSAEATVPSSPSFIAGFADSISGALAQLWGMIKGFFGF